MQEGGSFELGLHGATTEARSIRGMEGTSKEPEAVDCLPQKQAFMIGEGTSVLKVESPFLKRVDVFPFPCDVAGIDN